ncbi:MAG: PqqD family protein [Chromatiales bacterium]|nr:PqqD family protein [Chromatiales bacterium]
MNGAPTPIAPDAVFRPSAAVVRREVVGETLLIPVSGHLAHLDDVFTLNPTAAFVWSLLDGERDLETVERAVRERYEVDHDEAWRDLEALVASLHEAGLLEMVER